MLLETATHLGPARVMEAAGLRLRLALEDRAVSATLALPYPYQPVPGDRVLAIGHGEDFYVIGVLEGTGKTVFTAPGKIEFRAPEIAFAAPKTIRMTGKKIDLRAEEYQVTARTAVEQFGEAYRWVRDVIQVRAGEVRQVVAGKYGVTADRIVEVADKDVQIDGRQINLG